MARVNNKLILAALALCAPAPTLCAQIALDEKPRRYLSIQVADVSREWEVRPIKILDRTGGILMGATENDFQPKPDRWERTGLPRRYLVEPWRRAFERYAGPQAPAGARFYFYAINPRQPSAEGKLTLVDARRREYWVAAQSVTIKAYPMTWVDVFEGYVGQFSGEERRAAVKQWEEAHREIILNTGNLETGFTQEERNEFASFYQGQFVFIRDRDPTLHSIYDELAAFHRERANLDAELSTYLDGLRSGVPSPHRERFHLEVGRMMVQRLRLHSDAQPHLAAAQEFAQARYLLSLCRLKLRQAARARKALGELIQLLQSPPPEGGLTLELTPEEELGRAHLLLAEVEFSLGSLAAAGAALDKIPTGSSFYEEGRLVFAAMLLYRNDLSQGGDKIDPHKAREAIRVLPLWQQAQEYLAPKPETVFPLHPPMARALVLYAQADPQFRETQANKRPTPELLRMLEAAKKLDPLSSEPWLAEGRVWARMGHFREAMAAFMGGLDVNPHDVQLNFSVADLNFKAGVIALAKDYLARCLKHEPDFWPALSRLGEAAMLDIESLRAQLLIRQNAGESVDYAGELVPFLKEAAAFWTASLAINPEQPATQHALATLYLQLAELAPLAQGRDGVEVRRAYLTKARDLAFALVLKVRAYPRSTKPPTDDRARAEAPTLAAFNTWAFALYALGDIDGARAAFEEHLRAAQAQDILYFPDSQARAAYQTSAALAYALEWLRRINENNRRYFEVVEFDKDSAPPPDYYFHGWNVSGWPKPDGSFSNSIKMEDGRLHLGVKQKDDNATSRLEIEKPFASLAVFEAEFVATGRAAMNRGIHLTKVQSGAGSSGDLLLATIMLGVDPLGQVFYETRRFRKDAPQDREEMTQDYGLVDVRSYGGSALGENERLTLALKRQLSEDKAFIEYIAVINGWEVKLKVEDSDLKSQELKTGNAKLRCGFFTQAALGASGTVEVERVKFIYDSGLGD